MWMLALALACSDMVCKLALNVCERDPLKARCRRLHVFSVIPLPSSRLAVLRVTAGMLRGRQAVLMCVAGWLFMSLYVGGVSLTALSLNKSPSEHQILQLNLFHLLQGSTRLSFSFILDGLERGWEERRKCGLYSGSIKTLPQTEDLGILRLFQCWFYFSSIALCFLQRLEPIFTASDGVPPCWIFKNHFNCFFGVKLGSAQSEW